MFKFEHYIIMDAHLGFLLHLRCQKWITLPCYLKKNKKYQGNERKELPGYAKQEQANEKKNHDSVRHIQINIFDL